MTELTHEQVYDLVDLIGNSYHSVLDSSLRPASPDRFDQLCILNQHRQALDQALRWIQSPHSRFDMPAGIHQALEAILMRVDEELNNANQATKDQRPMHLVDDQTRSLADSIHAYMLKERKKYEATQEVLDRARALARDPDHGEGQHLSNLNALQESVEHMDDLDGRCNP